MRNSPSQPTHLAPAPNPHLTLTPRPSPQLLSDLEADLAADALQPKRGMKDRFGRPRIKRDGTEAKVKTIAPMHVLQVDPDTRYEWIDYSALDAKVRVCVCV